MRERHIYIGVGGKHDEEAYREIETSKHMHPKTCDCDRIRY